jgi:hypothetical protein
VKPPDVLKPYEAADRLKRAYVQVLYCVGICILRKRRPVLSAPKRCHIYIIVYPSG